MTKAEKMTTYDANDLHEEDWCLIYDIAGRAEALFKDTALQDASHQDIRMDLESAHLDLMKGGMWGLDLHRLLEADEDLFFHDIGGIMTHMDRTRYPGKLTGCFLPKARRTEDFVRDEIWEVDS